MVIKVNKCRYIKVYKTFEITYKPIYLDIIYKKMVQKWYTKNRV